LPIAAVENGNAGVEMSDPEPVLLIDGEGVAVVIAETVFVGVLFDFAGMIVMKNAVVFGADPDAAVVAGYY
jgi:hypothetical protein